MQHIARRLTVRKSSATVLVLIVVGIAFSSLLVADPNSKDSIFPPCLFKALTGLFCPGCGATRAMHALLHGDLRAALRMNSLLVLALPLLPLLALSNFNVALDRLPLVLRRLTDARPWAGTVIAYFALRNLPWWPFQWLAPG